MAAEKRWKDYASVLLHIETNIYGCPECPFYRYETDCDAHRACAHDRAERRHRYEDFFNSRDVWTWDKNSCRSA